MEGRGLDCGLGRLDWRREESLVVSQCRKAEQMSDQWDGRGGERGSDDQYGTAQKSFACGRGRERMAAFWGGVLEFGPFFTGLVKRGGWQPAAVNSARARLESAVVLRLQYIIKLPMVKSSTTSTGRENHLSSLVFGRTQSL